MNNAYKTAESEFSETSIRFALSRGYFITRYGVGSPGDWVADSERYIEWQATCLSLQMDEVHVFVHPDDTSLADVGISGIINGLDGELYWNLESAVGKMLPEYWHGKSNYFQSGDDWVHLTEPLEFRDAKRVARSLAAYLARSRGCPSVLEQLGLETCPKVQIKKTTATHFVIDCPFCGKEHRHGKAYGHRVAHCGPSKNAGGYYIAKDLALTDNKFMVKLFKDGKALALQTDASDEVKFTRDFATALQDYITSPKFEGQHEIETYYTTYVTACEPSITVARNHNGQT